MCVSGLAEVSIGGMDHLDQQQLQWMEKRFIRHTIPKILLSPVEEAVLLRCCCKPPCISFSCPAELDRLVTSAVAPALF